MNNSSIPTGPVREDEGQIPSEFSALISSVNALSTMVDNLEEKLAPIVFPDGIVSETKISETKPEPLLCSMATNIKTEQERVSKIVVRLAKLLKCIQL